MGHQRNSGPPQVVYCLDLRNFPRSIDTTQTPRVLQKQRNSLTKPCLHKLHRNKPVQPPERLEAKVLRSVTRTNALQIDKHMTGLTVKTAVLSADKNTGGTPVSSSSGKPAGVSSGNISSGTPTTSKSTKPSSTTPVKLLRANPPLVVGRLPKAAAAGSLNGAPGVAVENDAAKCNENDSFRLNSLQSDSGTGDSVGRAQLAEKARSSSRIPGKATVKPEAQNTSLMPVPSRQPGTEQPTHKLPSVLDSKCDERAQSNAGDAKFGQQAAVVEYRRPNPSSSAQHNADLEEGEARFTGLAAADQQAHTGPYRGNNRMTQEPRRDDRTSRDHRGWLELQAHRGGRQDRYHGRRGFTGHGRDHANDWQVFGRGDGPRRHRDRDYRRWDDRRHQHGRRRERSIDRRRSPDLQRRPRERSKSPRRAASRSPKRGRSRSPRRSSARREGHHPKDRRRRSESSSTSSSKSSPSSSSGTTSSRSPARSPAPSNARSRARSASESTSRSATRSKTPPLRSVSPAAARSNTEAVSLAQPVVAASLAAAHGDSNVDTCTDRELNADAGAADNQQPASVLEETTVGLKAQQEVLKKQDAHQVQPMDTTHVSSLERAMQQAPEAHARAGDVGGVVTATVTFSKTANATASPTPGSADVSPVAHEIAATGFKVDGLSVHARGSTTQLSSLPLSSPSGRQLAGTRQPSSPSPSAEPAAQPQTSEAEAIFDTPQVNLMILKSPPATTRNDGGTGPQAPQNTLSNIICLQSIILQDVVQSTPPPAAGSPTAPVPTSSKVASAPVSPKQVPPLCDTLPLKSPEDAAPTTTPVGQSSCTEVLDHAEADLTKPSVPSPSPKLACRSDARPSPVSKTAAPQQQQSPNPSPACNILTATLWQVHSAVLSGSPPIGFESGQRATTPSPADKSTIATVLQVHSAVLTGAPPIGFESGQRATTSGSPAPSTAVADLQQPVSAVHATSSISAPVSEEQQQAVSATPPLATAAVDVERSGLPAHTLADHHELPMSPAALAPPPPSDAAGADTEVLQLLVPALTSVPHSASCPRGDGLQTTVPSPQVPPPTDGTPSPPPPPLHATVSPPSPSPQCFADDAPPGVSPPPASPMHMSPVASPPSDDGVMPFPRPPADAPLHPTAQAPLHHGHVPHLLIPPQPRPPSGDPPHAVQQMAPPPLMQQPLLPHAVQPLPVVHGTAPPPPLLVGPHPPAVPAVVRAMTPADPRVAAAAGGQRGPYAAAATRPELATRDSGGIHARFGLASPQGSVMSDDGSQEDGELPAGEGSVDADSIMARIRDRISCTVKTYSYNVPASHESPRRNFEHLTAEQLFSKPGVYDRLMRKGALLSEWSLLTWDNGKDPETVAQTNKMVIPGTEWLAHEDLRPAVVQADPWVIREDKVDFPWERKAACTDPRAQPASEEPVAVLLPVPEFALWEDATDWEATLRGDAEDTTSGCSWSASPRPCRTLQEATSAPGRTTHTARSTGRLWPTSRPAAPSHPHRHSTTSQPASVHAPASAPGASDGSSDADGSPAEPLVPLDPDTGLWQTQEYDGKLSAGSYTMPDLRQQLKEGLLKAGISLYRKADKLWLPLTENTISLEDLAWKGGNRKPGTALSGKPTPDLEALLSLSAAMGKTARPAGTYVAGAAEAAAEPPNTEPSPSSWLPGVDAEHLVQKRDEAVDQKKAAVARAKFLLENRKRATFGPPPPPHLAAALRAKLLQKLSEKDGHSLASHFLQDAAEKAYAKRTGKEPTKPSRGASTRLAMVASIKQVGDLKLRIKRSSTVELPTLAGSTAGASPSGPAPQVLQTQFPVQISSQAVGPGPSSAEPPGHRDPGRAKVDPAASSASHGPAIGQHDGGPGGPVDADRGAKPERHKSGKDLLEGKSMGKKGVLEMLRKRKGSGREGTGVVPGSSEALAGTSLEQPVQGVTHRSSPFLHSSPPHERHEAGSLPLPASPHPPVVAGEPPAAMPDTKQAEPIAAPQLPEPSEAQAPEDVIPDDRHATSPASPSRPGHAQVDHNPDAEKQRCDQQAGPSASSSPQRAAEKQQYHQRRDSSPEDSLDNAPIQQGGAQRGRSKEKTPPAAAAHWRRSTHRDTSPKDSIAQLRRSQHPVSLPQSPAADAPPPSATRRNTPTPKKGKVVRIRRSEAAAAAEGSDVDAGTPSKKALDSRPEHEPAAVPTADDTAAARRGGVRGGKVRGNAQHHSPAGRMTAAGASHDSREEHPPETPPHRPGRLHEAPENGPDAVQPRTAAGDVSKTRQGGGMQDDAAEQPPRPPKRKVSGMGLHEGESPAGAPKRLKADPGSPQGGEGPSGSSPAPQDESPAQPLKVRLGGKKSESMPSPCEEQPAQPGSRSVKAHPPMTAKEEDKAPKPARATEKTPEKSRKGRAVYLNRAPEPPPPPEVTEEERKARRKRELAELLKKKRKQAKNPAWGIADDESEGEKEEDEEEDQSRTRSSPVPHLKKKRLINRDGVAKSGGGDMFRNSVVGKDVGKGMFDRPGVARDSGRERPRDVKREKSPEDMFGAKPRAAPKPKDSSAKRRLEEEQLPGKNQKPEEKALPLKKQVSARMHMDSAAHAEAPARSDRLDPSDRPAQGRVPRNKADTGAGAGPTKVGAGRSRLMARQESTDMMFEKKPRRQERKVPTPVKPKKPKKAAEVDEDEDDEDVPEAYKEKAQPLRKGIGFRKPQSKEQPNLVADRAPSPSEANAPSADRERVWLGTMREVHTVLTKMDKTELSSTFAQPVLELWADDEEFVDDYKRIVTHPMDLRTVWSKIRQKEYESSEVGWECFIADLLLMASNCHLFNQDNPTYTDFADKFEAEVKKLDKRFREKAQNKLHDH